MVLQYTFRFGRLFSATAVYRPRRRRRWWRRWWRRWRPRLRLLLELDVVVRNVDSYFHNCLDRRRCRDRCRVRRRDWRPVSRVRRRVAQQQQQQVIVS